MGNEIALRRTEECDEVQKEKMEVVEEEKEEEEKNLRSMVRITVGA